MQYLVQKIGFFIIYRYFIDWVLDIQIIYVCFLYLDDIYIRNDCYRSIKLYLKKNIFVSVYYREVFMYQYCVLGRLF